MAFAYGSSGAGRARMTQLSRHCFSLKLMTQAPMFQTETPADAGGRSRCFSLKHRDPTMMFQTETSVRFSTTKRISGRSALREMMEDQPHMPSGSQMFQSETSLFPAVAVPMFQTETFEIGVASLPACKGKSDQTKVVFQTETSAYRSAASSPNLFETNLIAPHIMSSFPTLRGALNV